MMNFKDLSMVAAPFRGEGVVDGKSLNQDDGDCKLYFLTGSNCGQRKGPIIIRKKLMPDLHVSDRQRHIDEVDGSLSDAVRSWLPIFFSPKSLLKIRPEFLLF